MNSSTDRAQGARTRVKEFSETIARTTAVVAALATFAPVSPVSAEVVTSTGTVQIGNSSIGSIDAGDRFHFSISFDDSMVDTYNSSLAGQFPGAVTAFSLARDPNNGGSWDPAGGAFSVPADAFSNTYTAPQAIGFLALGGTGFPELEPSKPFGNVTLMFSSAVLSLFDVGSGQTLAQVLNGVEFDDVANFAQTAFSLRDQGASRSATGSLVALRSVPEPATWALAAIAVCGVTIRRRSHRAGQGTRWAGTKWTRHANGVPHRCSMRLVAVLCLALCGSTVAHAVSFDWAAVGNVGNSADAATGFGAVDYRYYISKHEVTNSQYTEFLNTVDPTGGNALALYDAEMAGNFGGIVLEAGNADGAKFVVKAGREQNPVTYISWLDSARFVNWLHNGQGAGSTETGAYTISDGIAETRSPGGKFFIPSENEWYKAAYHDAAAGTSGSYFTYANGSDSVPTSDVPADDPAAANFQYDDLLANGFNDGYAVSGSTTFPSASNPLTDVGAYASTTSPYGLFDANGNVAEWTERIAYSAYRVNRGGGWFDYQQGLRKAGFSAGAPADGNYLAGLRVVSMVPEPSGVALGVLALLGGLGCRGRRSE